MIKIGKVGPVAALTLIELWLEGKHSMTLTELEDCEKRVIDTLTRFEDKMDRMFGHQEHNDEIPSYTDPSET